jgi:5-methyltetrahydrofolate--homocysteine methyltransferase
MAEHVQWPGRATGTGIIAVVPNAGLPVLVDGKTVYPLEPAPSPSALAEFVEKRA